MKGHCFVNGVEKHVKCAYVGVNGKAQYIKRPRGVIRIGSAIAKLSTARYNLAAGEGLNYALFGGGNGPEGVSSTVDAYSRSDFIRKTAANLSEAREALVAPGWSNEYVLFCGGVNKNYSRTATVDAYDRDLTRKTATSLSEAKSYLATAPSMINGGTLFAGGIIDADPGVSSTVDNYDRDLTRTTVANLSVGRAGLAATMTGGFVLFGGGNGPGRISSTIDVYDHSLTRMATANLSVGRYYLAGAGSTKTNFEACALFAGGILETDPGVSSTVDAYDYNLTRRTVANLSENKSRLAAAYLMEEQLLFAGGKTDQDNGVSSTVDVYDTMSLTKTTANDLSEARYGLAATMIGYALLFGGGLGSDYSSAVDAYEYNFEPDD